MNDLGLVIKGRKAVVSSRDVARVFEKEHKNVLRDIREIVEADDDFSRLNFEPSDYTDERGKEQPEYIMNRDGFVLLAMGFTGYKAMAFKKAYIRAFNEMESRLKAIALSVSRDPLLINAMLKKIQVIQGIMENQDADPAVVAEAAKEIFESYGEFYPAQFVSPKKKSNKYAQLALEAHV